LNIVRVSRLTLAGLSSDRPASVAMQWIPDGGKRRRKTWQQTFQKIYRRCESAGVVFAEWLLLVIAVSVKVSSPNVPAEVGGFKCKK